MLGRVTFIQIWVVLILIRLVVSMSERLARREASRPNRARANLAKLAELKRSGRKQIDAYEIKEEQAVYDLLADDEYAELVQDRRAKGGQQLAVFRLRDGMQCAMSHGEVAPPHPTASGAERRPVTCETGWWVVSCRLQHPCLLGIAACVSYLASRLQ